MTKILALGRKSNGLLVPIAVDSEGKILLSTESGQQQFEGLIVGDYPNNYFEVENDGTFELVGNATTWRDELGPLLASRLESPSSDIVQNLAEGTITFEDSARTWASKLGTKIQIYDINELIAHSMGIKIPRRHMLLNNAVKLSIPFIKFDILKFFPRIVKTHGIREILKLIKGIVVYTRKS